MISCVGSRICLFNGKFIRFDVNVVPLGRYLVFDQTMKTS